MNKLIENIRQRIAHNKPILSHISRVELTPQYEELLKTIFENIIIDESQRIEIDEQLKKDLAKPSYLSIKQYVSYMTVKIIRLSSKDMKDENMKRTDKGEYDALINLTDKDSTSALKGKHWKKITKALKYLLKNDKVKFVFVEFIGDSSRMFRGIKNLSDILKFLELWSSKVLIKGFLVDIRDALINATTLSKAHVSGKLKAKVGDETQSGNTHTIETITKEHKSGISAIKTHSNALLVPQEYLIIEHDIKLNDLLVKHQFDETLITFLKGKITPEEELRKEIREKDDIIKRLLDKIDNLEK